MTTWLLITCGLPFSGKSTLAKAVAERLGAIRVSVDDLIPELLDPTLQPTTEKAWRDAYLAAIHQTEEHLAQGETVVFDSVGHTRKNRYRLRRLAERVPAKTLVVHLAVDQQEALARLEANTIEPTRPNVPRDGFDEIAREFELPDESEVAITYQPSRNLAAWIDETLIPIMNGA